MTKHKSNPSENANPTNSVSKTSDANIPELRINNSVLDAKSADMDFDQENDTESNQSIQNDVTRPSSQQTSSKPRSKSMPSEFIQLKDMTDNGHFLSLDWEDGLSKRRRPSNISESGSVRRRLRQGYLPEQSDSKFS